jgi:hypothetical protein
MAPGCAVGAGADWFGNCADAVVAVRRVSRAQVETKSLIRTFMGSSVCHQVGAGIVHPLYQIAEGRNSVATGVSRGGLFKRQLRLRFELFEPEAAGQVMEVAPVHAHQAGGRRPIATTLGKSAANERTLELSGRLLEIAGNRRSVCRRR